jgi:glycosyltransferase involved in cell wall biosynthesis
MRIALLCWESLHSVAVGGVAVHVTELAAALERRGHEIHVFLNSPAAAYFYCKHKPESAHNPIRRPSEEATGEGVVIYLSLQLFAKLRPRKVGREVVCLLLLAFATRQLKSSPLSRLMLRVRVSSPAPLLDVQ